jgi:hypothetical protein
VVRVLVVVVAEEVDVTAGEVDSAITGDVSVGVDFFFANETKGDLQCWF